VALTCSVAGAADPVMPSLLMFGNETSPQGRWRLEVLESSDPESLAAARQTGAISVCMNAATEMGKKAQQQTTSECTSRTLKNTRSVAQIESTCPPQRKTVMTLTRESPSAILMEWNETGGQQKPTRMKARYHYEGPCKDSDPTMKFEKDSEACVQMRKSLAETNPLDACSGMPADQKAQCVRQIESSMASMAKMCQ
jgi:hypothetical protein